jgi:glycosyltransferase involved in cell wall biosynthesis
MKIGISTRGLHQGSHAISTIIYNISRSIIDLSPSDHEFILYLNDPSFVSLFDPSLLTRTIKLKNRLIFDQIWLPAVLKQDKIDIVLFMKGTMPTLLPCRGAVMFHDFGYFDTSLRPYRFLETIYMSRMMALAGRKASVIYTISENTKREAVKTLGIEAQKIRVCYSNVSSIFQPITDKERLDKIKSLYKLPQPFIFCPISLSPRKNFTRILNAFNEVKTQIHHHLVITGGQSWGNQHQGVRLNSDVNNRVHILGNVPQDHMPAIYSMADFTLYPSLIEGFGFPILESFRCGCPVLTSNITSMPEVAGEAAYLVDPYDQGQITEGILKLSQDRVLREELIRKGFDRSKLFSWENTAGIILDGLVA